MTPETLRSLLDAIRGTPGIPVIMGPTAAGKSELAFALARECGGEIVSADSMQFYRGLDIGTAKPTAEERRLVPHHLIDSMDISEKSDVFRFRTDALRIIDEIRSRGHLPVVAGGSGLYLHVLVYGLDVLPAKQSLRDELDAAYDNDAGFPELAAVMERECPLDFKRFYPHRRTEGPEKELSVTFCRVWCLPATCCAPGLPAVPPQPWPPSTRSPPCVSLLVL